jgi:hypothetical protein
MKAIKSRVLYFPLVAITIGLIASCSNGDNALGNTDNLKWKDVIYWNYSWNPVDSTTYLDDGKNFNVSEAVRVEWVFDPKQRLGHVA